MYILIIVQLQGLYKTYQNALLDGEFWFDNKTMKPCKRSINLSDKIDQVMSCNTLPLHPVPHPTYTHPPTYADVPFCILVHVLVTVEIRLLHIHLTNSNVTYNT